MRRAAAALPLILCASWAPIARAGFYLMPRAEWGAFAPRAQGDEPTPNLYGYGGDLSMGYSLRQAFDIGLYGSYLPGTPQHAQFGKGDGTLVSYGGELGLRFADSVYLGLKGGPSAYQLQRQSESDELPGKWTGDGAGFAIGAVNRLSKTAFVQTTIEVMHHVLKGAGGATGSRQLDSFDLGVAYMWNSKGDSSSSAIETTIFKNFLDSIVFF